MSMPPSASCFYPRSRTGSDGHAVRERVRSVSFLSALPHGERRYHVGKNGDDDVFLSALPHGERLPGFCGPALCLPFLSALPHGERPESLGRVSPDDAVSIRAPARGAT